MPLQTILRILEELRGEAIEAAENPAEGYRSEYGLGRVAGMLQLSRRAAELVTQAATEQAETTEPSFEGES